MKRLVIIFLNQCCDLSDTFWPSKSGNCQTKKSRTLCEKLISKIYQQLYMYIYFIQVQNIYILSINYFRGYTWKKVWQKVSLTPKKLWNVRLFTRESQHCFKSYCCFFTFKTFQNNSHILINWLDQKNIFYKYMYIAINI